MKRPAFQFYPADWKKDANLQGCSLAARGLWIEIMCIAHQCELYGHLVINGQPMSTAQISRLAGATPAEVKRLLAELENAKVFSRSPTEAIYSRRMVADEQLRNARAEGGKGGSDHGYKGAEHGSKGGRPRKTKGPEKPPLEPPPSSSSSSSDKSVSAIALPPGVTDEDWKAFKDHRVALRKKLTPRAEELAAAKLHDLARQGYDAKKLLNHAIGSGWLTFYERDDCRLDAPTPITSGRPDECPCGAPATVKVGGKWRCKAHVRDEPVKAAA